MRRSIMILTLWTARAVIISWLVGGCILLDRSSVKAQCDDVVFDEPSVTSVAVGDSIVLNGEGFCQEIQVFLNINNDNDNPYPLDIVEYIDSKHVRVLIGADIPADDYMLCAEVTAGRCWGPKLAVTPAFSFKLREIQPEAGKTYVYNTEQANRRIGIRGTTNGEYDETEWQLELVRQDGGKVPISNDSLVDWSSSPSTGSLALSFDVPVALEQGEYQLSITTPKGVVSSTNSIGVRLGLNPNFESGFLEEFRQFDDGDRTFTITAGIDLTGTIETIAFDAKPDEQTNFYSDKTIECDANDEHCEYFETGMRFSTNFRFNGSGEYSVSAILEDGTSHDVGAIKIYERVWPVTASGIAIFVSALLSIGLIVRTVYYLYLSPRKETELAANQQIVSNRRVIAILVTAGIIVLIASSWAYLVWSSIFNNYNSSIFSNNYNSSYYIAIGLASFNTAMLFVFNRINRVFFDAFGRATRYLAVAMLMAAIWLSLFAVDFYSLPQLARWVEFAIFLLIVLTGFFGIAYNRQALEVERAKLDDAQILARTEALLLADGRVNATAGSIDAPVDRIERAIEILNERYRDSWTTYDATTKELAFIRAGQVKMVHDIFTTDKAPESAVDELQSSSPTTMRPNDMMTLLDTELGFKPATLRNLPQQDTSPFIVHGRSVPSIPWLPQSFPVILLDSNAPLSDADVEQLKDIRNEMQIRHRFGLFVPLTNSEQVTVRINAELKSRRAATNDNLVILGRQQLIDVFTSDLEPIQRALMVPIRDQVDLQVFESVFITFGPVSETMFYGRSQELVSIFDTVDGGNSATIMGTRKMGKTSLLRRLESQVENRNKVVLYADLHAVASYAAFYFLVADKWDTLGLNIQSWSEPHQFVDYVTRVSKQNEGKQIVFMFDEVDRLLDADISQGELLFRLFRSLSQEGRCQFVFTGERTILDAVADPKSAFWNFTVPVKLPLFDCEVTRNLIVEPFTSIGVTIEDEEKVVGIIHSYTAGHPTLIQAFCQQTLQVLNRQHERNVTLEITRTVANNLKYQEDANNPFLGVFLSQSTELEKAIAVHIAHRGPLSKPQILDELREQGFPMTKSRLERGIRYLMLGHVLKLSEDGRYELKPDHLKEYMFTVPYEEYMSDLLDEYNDDLRG